ncbi:hypothetical protein HPP92_003528 [Vanilla planifolia]|uniref:Fe2OG dioxygenase domain-containing protein n=1 Tax=Vanilla planifolia TaxID=51239 RepID=A0A835S7B3_VANPL|nr:hypothetical protein HPP92_003528 [Vanilla planifolia]
MAGREDELGRKKKKSGKETTVNWLNIKPKKDLQINRLKSNHLFTIPNFLTACEAKAFIEAAEAIGFTHQGSLGPANGEAYRDNDRIAVIDPLLAEGLWESGLKKIFADIRINGMAAVGLNSNIRFYRYNVGQHFGQHIDESVLLEPGLRTYYTLLVYLSGNLCPRGKNNSGSNTGPSVQPLVGGETVFYERKQRVVAEVAPTVGMALLHLHGAKCMLHEARAVTKGVKYVLRSDVAFA